MKIAIFSLYSGHINRGVETWVRDFAETMSKYPIVVFQGGKDEAKHSYEVKTIQVSLLRKLTEGEKTIYQILVPLYLELLKLFFTLRSLIYLIKFKPDVVMPSNGGVQTFILKMLSVIFNWKLVIVGHAGIGAPDKWNLLCRPDLFISPSKRGKVWAESLFFSKGLRIVSIPHGIDLAKFSNNLKKVSLPLERPIILCVSSFDPYKRVELAVEVVSRLKKGSLLVIGGDRGQGFVDEIGKKLLGKSRYLKLKVDPAQMPVYYDSADLFTLPSSEYEAFGIVYLEALAANLPVVATDDALRREIVGNAGILVDPIDAEAYKKALEKALGISWGDIPRKQAEKYSWNEISKKYDKELNKLIN